MESLEIPVRDFDDGMADLDLDNLPPDLQALLAPTSAGEGSNTGSLSIPSDLQSLAARSQAVSRGSQCGCIFEVDTGADSEPQHDSSAGTSSPQACNASRAPSAPPLGFEWRIDFDVLRRSNTLAAGLPAAMQRSARKIEREALVVSRLNGDNRSAPPSRQACLSASSGRLSALAYRCSLSAGGLGASAPCGQAQGGIGPAASSTIGAGRPPLPPSPPPPRQASPPADLAPPVIHPTDDEIDEMLQGTIRDDDVNRILQPWRPYSRVSSTSGRESAPPEVSYVLHPPRGLANLGNTCFLNAAVQALGHCAPLTAYLLQGMFVMDLNEANPLGTGCVLTMVFAALLHEVFALRSVSPTSVATCTASCRSGVGTDTRSSLDALTHAAAAAADMVTQAEGAVLPPFPPFDFLLAVARFHPFLATGEMHDAQELLAWLLDALHEDLNRVTQRPPPGSQGTCHVVVPANAAEDSAQERYAAQAWCHHLHGNRSVIVDLFQGQLRSQLRCPKCGARSLTFDPFLHLTLPLPPGRQAVTLQDVVTMFCQEEVLDSSNLWQCPTCGDRVLAQKKLDLWKLPPLLMVQLKRFEWVEDRRTVPPSFCVRKLTCLVDLPQECLDLQPLVAAEAPQKEPLLYDLVAVVDHLGTHAEAGHYTATCRRPDGWCRFDDAHAAMLGAGVTVVGPQNYVLFMERRGAPTEPQAIAEQRPSEPHAWPHVIDVDWSFLGGFEA